MTDLSDRYNKVDPVMIEKRKRQIRSIRYKVYLFVITVFRVFFWPTFMSSIETVRGVGALKFGAILTDGVQQTLFVTRGEEGLLNELDQIEEKLTSAEKDIEKAQLENDIIKELNDVGKQFTIINCLNFDECDDVDQELLKKIDLLRTYIVLTDIDSFKMNYNQRYFLKSIDSFLLRTEGGLPNGELLSVNFGNPKPVEDKYHLYALPFNITVEFDHKNMLFSFLENVERRVNMSLPILYRVESLNYDIIEYRYKQVVKVNMSAYYYDFPEEMKEQAKEFEEERQEQNEELLKKLDEEHGDVTQRGAFGQRSHNSAGSDTGSTTTSSEDEQQLEEQFLGSGEDGAAAEQPASTGSSAATGGA